MLEVIKIYFIVRLTAHKVLHFEGGDTASGCAEGWAYLNSGMSLRFVVTAVILGYRVMSTSNRAAFAS